MQYTVEPIRVRVQICNHYTTSGPTGLGYNRFHYNMFNHEENILKSFMIMKSSLSIGALHNWFN